MTAARRRVGRRAGLGLAVAAAVLAGPALSSFAAHPAGAEPDSIEIGVWWRDQLDGASLPAPPDVPSGGLWVSSDPGGPSAISAIRFAMADTDSAPVLTLHVAQSNTAPDSAAGTGAPRVLACVVTTPWQATTAGTPGAWSARPTYDCGKAQAPGLPSPDGTVVTFDLSAMAADGGGTVTAALVPADVTNPVVTASPAPPPASPVPVAPGPAPAPLPAPPDPGAPTSPSTFDVTFNPPKVEDIAVTSTPKTATDSSAASVPDLSAAGDLSATASIGAVSSGALVSAPAPAAAPDVAAGPVQPAKPVVALPVPRAVRQAASSVSDRSTVRLVFGLLFAGLAGWAWRLFSQQPATSGGRAFLTLYDVPPAATTDRPRLARGPRVGRPPSLR